MVGPLSAGVSGPRTRIYSYSQMKKNNNININVYIWLYVYDKRARGRAGRTGGRAGKRRGLTVPNGTFQPSLTEHANRP